MQSDQVFANKYTVNNKNKVVISSKKQYRMHLWHSNKKNTNPYKHSKKPYCGAQAFVSTCDLEPDSKFINIIE